MFTLTVENKRGQRFTLTNNESQYQVVSVDGLNPPNATIQLTTVAGMDGSRFASSKLGIRNIVLNIKINGNIETNRLYLYNYFKTKQYCKIYYTNDSRSIYAEGYVETIECPLFENGQTMQVSIVCHDPYLKSIDEIIYDLSSIIGCFEFPFAFGGIGVIAPTTTDDAIEFSIIEKDRIINIPNDGDTSSGFIVEVLANGTVVNPMIYCVDTNEFFQVNTTLNVGDLLTIDTIAGEKSVTLLHDGNEINALRFVERGSSWLKVDIGGNQFAYDASNGEEFMSIMFRFRTRFEGV